MFCSYFSLQPLPASLQTLCLYVQFLSRSMVPPSIRNYLSGVKHMHVVLGYEFPYSSNLVLKLVFRGIERLHPHVPQRAPPILPEHLLAISCILDWHDLSQVTTFTIALFLFLTLSRLGNILPSSHSKFSRKLHLCFSDVSVSSFGLLIKFRHTKTIQLGKRQLLVPVLRVNGSRLCLTSSFEHMLNLFHINNIFPGPKSSPFLHIHNRKLVSVTKQSFITQFRSLLQTAGVANSSQYRGHSFRRGGASHAFRAGLPCEIIKVYGDWKSEAYQVYLDISLETKLSYALCISSALSTL